MSSRRSVGVSGSAVLVGTAGLYLAYIGVKDIPFFDGLRSLFKNEPLAKQTRTIHKPYTPKPGNIGNAPVGEQDKGINLLVGNAASAYNVYRNMGRWPIYGWGLRPDMSSDHPKGLALDIMHPTPSEATLIINTFRTLPGAKYWIWNREIANVNVDNWRVRPYRGPNPHTDHVHLSFS